MRAARYSTVRGRTPAPRRPLVEWCSAERSVEALCRFVPVEHGPLHATLRADAQRLEQRPAVAVAPGVRFDEQVLEPDAGPADPRREGPEPQREADDLPVVVLSDEAARHRVGAEEMLLEHRRCRL